MVIKLADLPGDKGMLQGRKRVGRGESSGWGRTAGKGNKGETARSGSPKGKTFEGGQTPISRRLPKRGFSNQRWSVPVVSLNVSQLERFENDSNVSLLDFVKEGMVSKNAPRVKILGDGNLTKKLTVEAHAFSESARQKIEAAGGQCSIKETSAAAPASE